MEEKAPWMTFVEVMKMKKSYAVSVISFKRLC